MNEVIRPAEDPRIDPCEHLKDQASACADGTLGGFARLYMWLHMKTCGRCRKAFLALRVLRERLLGLGVRSSGSTPMSSDRKTALEEALTRVDDSGDW